MLEVHVIRELVLEAPSAPGRAAHLSAASGLVRRADFLYVVGDDENHLAVFDHMSGAPGRLVPLFEGELPIEHAARKAAKGDLEALTVLPPFGGHAHGALLALGSGSTSARQRGAAVALAADGALAGDPVVLDLAPLYEFLRGQVVELNIEGVAVRDGRLTLLQRGNSDAGDNLVIDLDLDDVAGHVLGDGVIRAREVLDLRRYDLGHSGDVVLTFTDADALPDGRLVFAAAAEDTSDPYEDGAIVGSAVGIIGRDGDIERVEPLADTTLKVEGVDAVLSDEQIHLLLVCDADDPDVPSPLLSAAL